MTSQIHPGDRLSLALEHLQLQYSKVIDAQGQSFWQIPFGPPSAPTVLIAYTGPIAAGVIATVGSPQVDFEGLLRLSARLTLAKVILDNGVSILSECPVDHIDEGWLRLAIGAVLEGVKGVSAMATPLSP